MKLRLRLKSPLRKNLLLKKRLPRLKLRPRPKSLLRKLPLLRNKLLKSPLP